MTSSDFENADRLIRKRARMLPVFAIIFLFQQAAFLADSHPQERLVDHVAEVGAWLAMSVVLLLALTGGSFWVKSKEVRALMDDEVTRANRAEAFRIGFLVTMIVGMGLYVLDQFVPMHGHEAIHILVTVGVATALIVFGVLERRALKDG